MTFREFLRKENNISFFLLQKDLPKPVGLKQGSMAMGNYISVNLLLLDLAIVEFAIILAMKRNGCFKSKINTPQ